jgi:hypothetical protein
MQLALSLPREGTPANSGAQKCVFRQQRCIPAAPVSPHHIQLLATTHCRSMVYGSEVCATSLKSRCCALFVNPKNIGTILQKWCQDMSRTARSCQKTSKLSMRVDSKLDKVTEFRMILEHPTTVEDFNAEVAQHSTLVN